MKKCLSIASIFIGSIIFIISLFFILSDIFINDSFPFDFILIILLSIIFYFIGVTKLIKIKSSNFLKNYHSNLLVLVLSWLILSGLGIMKNNGIYWPEFILFSATTLPFIITYCFFSALINEYYKLTNSYLLFLNSLLGVAILIPFFMKNINYYNLLLLFIFLQIFISIISKKKTL
ncbi:MAG: hypothetical protein ABH881_04255 [bacterium]